MSSAMEDVASCAACGLTLPGEARFCPSCGRPLAVSSHAPTSPGSATCDVDPLIGAVIAERYRVVERLGRGGMGVVYRVEHVHIGKQMAMKLLSGELAHDAVTLARFEREAKAVSKLTHPNTVQIFDYGERDSLAYLVMEYLPGRDLAALIDDEGPLSFERVARIAAQIAASVEEAHQRGIIHRDVKPENVMVFDTSEQRDFVKVLDFGIAKLRDADGRLATQRGHLLGTPYYMAPEQIRAEQYDHRVDVYALGATMYKAVTGVTPYVADTPMEVLRKHLEQPLVAPSARAPECRVPREADRILRKALAKSPHQRHASMAELRAELERYLAGRARAPSRRPERAIEDDEARPARRWPLRLAAIVPVLLGLGYAGYRFVPALLSDAPLSMEREPNDEPGEANLLTPGHALRARIGKRRDAERGDADVYRIEPRPEARVVDVRVSGLPNIDLVLELVERGAERPLLTVDSAGVGEPERIPNVTLPRSAYHLRVREAVKRGEPPTENVSDAYTVMLALRQQAPDEEIELNDSFETAQPLAPGDVRLGVIGWATDRDVYCSPPDGSARTVELGGVPGIDLVLAYLDRNTNAGQRIDRAGVGEGERLELPRASSPRKACFTVSAREREGAGLADPSKRYRISVR